MADLYDVSSFHTGLYRAIASQANNIARITEGGELEDGTAFVGITPDAIKLNDTPERIKGRPTFEEGRLIITVGPLSDADNGGRIVHRDDRLISYLVMAMIALNRREQDEDEAAGGVGAVLAHRCDAFAQDFKSVFRDNDHLAFEGCPSGVVDTQSFAMGWDSEVQYPRAMALIRVTGQLYERPG